MKIVVAHAFPVPTQPTEAWFLVDNWAASLGYTVADQGAERCRIKRGSSMTHHTETETVRTAAAWGEITIRDGMGLAALAVAAEWSFGPIGSRREEWEEYLRAELDCLGREVGDAEKGRLLVLAERAGPPWSFETAARQVRHLGHTLLHRYRRGGFRPGRSNDGR